MPQETMKYDVSTELIIEMLALLENSIFNISYFITANMHSIGVFRKYT